MPPASAPPRIPCPHCQALIKAPALAPGSAVNCPKCGQGFRLGVAEGQESNVERRVSSVETSSVSASPKSNPGAPGQNPKSSPPPAPRRERKPDGLVDPNMLAPPPPRVKPKATTIVVVCALCGTRMDVPLDQIGHQVQCPDCHIVNEVKPPKESKSPPPKGPTLEGAKAFELSDPGDRPAYRPLQATRGEYKILSAFDPASADHALNLTAGAATAAEADDEVRLSAPIERPPSAPVLVLPPPDPDPEDKLRDGRYDDGLIGDLNFDRTQPEAWKKAPFLLGIFEFLFHLGTLPRWIFYSLGLGTIVAMVRGVIWAATAGTVVGEASQIPLVLFSTGLIAVWTPPFLAVLLAIVEDTGNGVNEVQSWPEWNVFDWIVNSVYIPAAVFFSGLPGGLVAALMLLGGVSPESSPLAIAAPVVLSWLVLFPPVFCSMLVEGSVMAPFSADVLRSFSAAADGCFLFVIYSIVLALLGVGAFSLILANNILFAALGAAGLVILTFLYARLLGRLIWFASQKDLRLRERRAQSTPAN